MTSIQIFLIASTCFLYLVAAGLFSKAVWFFEMYKVCPISDTSTVKYSWYPSGTMLLEEMQQRPEPEPVRTIFVKVCGMSM